MSLTIFVVFRLEFGNLQAPRIVHGLRGLGQVAVLAITHRGHGIYSW